MGKFNEKSPHGSSLKKPSKGDSKLIKSGVTSKATAKSHVLKIAKPTSGIKKIISKKEKQKLKHKKIEEKILRTKDAFKEDKARKKRQARPVIGDLKPLLDSLPSIDELLELRDKSNKTGIAKIDRRHPKKPKNRKEKRQQLIHEKTEKMLDRFDSVQKIWKSQEFRKDPRKHIVEQLRKRRAEMET